MASASFTADTTSDFANPERGWYIYASYGNGLLASSGTWQSEVATVKSNSYGVPLTLPFAYTGLGAYTGTDTIDNTALNLMRTNLAHLRTAGCKTIIRFFYGTGMSTPAASPSLARMQAHMAQIKAVLAEYRDVIYLVQNGFLGNYGEGWFTTNGTNGSDVDGKAAKLALHASVLDMVPKDIPINQTQLYVTMEVNPSALGAADAFSGSGLARAGMHNDCIMASANDQYQFPGPATINNFTWSHSALAMRNYCAAQSEYVPYGGETCAGSAQRLACTGGTDNAGLSGGILNEGPRYHQAYLNRAYYTGFMDAWSSGGCYSTASRLLGYRIQFDSISHADSVNRGSTLMVRVNMRNVGWARMSSMRRLMVRATNGGNVLTAYSPAQLRQLPSQASTSTQICVPLPIPGGAATGTWNVALEMPDAYANLASTRAFKVRPANANNGAQTWDDTNGRWATGTAFSVV